MTWRVRETESSVRHVVPVDDLREHDPEGCWCKPTVDAWGIVIHNALDRREMYERGEIQPH